MHLNKSQFSRTSVRNKLRNEVCFMSFILFSQSSDRIYAKLFILAYCFGLMVHKFLPLK